MSSAALAWDPPPTAFTQVEQFQQLREETALTPTYRERLESLMGALEGAWLDNWNGEGTRGVEPGSLAFTMMLLHVLPEGWPSPEIGVDPDGEISLEWSLGQPDRVVTVSVAKNGTLSYAGLFGDSRTHGVEVSVGPLPATIVDCLDRLYSFAPCR